VGSLIACVICRFPTDVKRRDRWAVRLRRQDNTTGRLWKLGLGAVVCAQHFHLSDFFWQWGRKLVKPDAEPTVFSFVPPVVQRRDPVHRSATITRVEEEACTSETAMDTDVASVTAKITCIVQAVQGN